MSQKLLICWASLKMSLKELIMPFKESAGLKISNEELSISSFKPGPGKKFKSGIPMEECEGTVQQEFTAPGKWLGSISVRRFYNV
jgi:hypothetical protein